MTVSSSISVMLYSAVTSTAGCSCQSQPGGRFCLAQHFTGKLLTMLLLCNDLSSQLIASRSFAATAVSAVINLMRIFLLTKVGSFVKNRTRLIWASNSWSFRENRESWKPWISLQVRSLLQRSPKDEPFRITGARVFFRPNAIPVTQQEGWN